MDTKLLKVDGRIITAQLLEINIDPHGYNAVTDVSSFEKGISIFLTETKLNILESRNKLSFTIFYKLRIRHIEEELAKMSCSVVWDIDAEPKAFMFSPLKLEVHNFYVSLFESSYYITIGALQQIMQQADFKGWSLGVFDEGYATQALKEMGLNIEDSHWRH